MANNKDPDEMAYRELFHEDLHSLHRYVFLVCWAERVKTDCIITYYFIVSGEISVYLMKIKVVSITSELISYHFTSD